MILCAFFAVAIFLFILYCFPIDLNKSRQFYDFMKFNVYYWIIVKLVILAFQILLSIFITDRRDITYYDDNLKIPADRLPQNAFTKDYCKYRNLFSLKCGNFCNVCKIMNIVPFLSVKADIRSTYENNYNSWSEGNVENSRLGETL